MTININVKIEAIQSAPNLYINLRIEGRDYLNLSTFLAGEAADAFFNSVRNAEAEFYAHDPRNPNRFPGNSSQQELL